MLAVADLSLKYPGIMLYPLVRSSPVTPTGSVSSVAGSTTLHSTWGWMRPTVATSLSSGVPGVDCQLTGAVSVMPYL